MNLLHSLSSMKEKNQSALSRKSYAQLVNTIGQILEKGRRKALQSVNQILVRTYWEIGWQIVEYEQQGKEKAEYGISLLRKLSKDLTDEHGKGFSEDNLEKMRKFYLLYKNSETLLRKLSWSHQIFHFYKTFLEFA